MQQAACQYSATNVTSFNCIVFDVLREDRGNLYQAQFAGSGGPVPPMWWFSARELAILSWPSTSALGSGKSSLRFSLAFVGVEAFWSGGNAVPGAARANPRHFFPGGPVGSLGTDVVYSHHLPIHALSSLPFLPNRH